MCDHGARNYHLYFYQIKDKMKQTSFEYLRKICIVHYFKKHSEKAILNAATTASQSPTLSHPEEGISDDEEAIESGDSVDDVDQPSPQEGDDATHKSIRC